MLQKLDCQRNLTRYTIMVDLSPENFNKSSTTSSTLLLSSTSLNHVNVNETIDASSKKTSEITLENKTVMMGLLISGALFVVAVIIVIKLYLDGRCIRLRTTRLMLSSSKGYRYNGRYSLY